MKTEWVHKKLGEVVVPLKGKLTEQSDCFHDSWELLINTSSIEGESKTWANPNNAVLCEPDDVLMLWDGERSGLVITEKKGVVGSTFARLRPNQELDGKFLYFFLLNNFEWIQNRRTGTGVPHAPKDLMRIFHISYPKSLSAQRRIAAILTSADKVIDSTRRLIEKYKKMKQGMMEDLLNEQCSMNNVQWRKVRLGECCSIHGRIGFRGYTTDDLVEKGYGAITFSPSDIHDFKLCYDDCDYISWKKYEESPEIKVFNGDILFCKTASIGKCAFVENLKEKATINPQFVVLKDFQCDPKLLYYILTSYEFQTQVQGITGGSTIKTMSQEKFGLEVVSMPPSISEQKHIAKIMSSIDRKIEEEQTILNKYTLLKKGLMEKLLNE